MVVEARGSDDDAEAMSTRSPIERLHVALDQAVAPLVEAHAARLQCRLGCAQCCVDELTVFEVEAEVIRREHAELLSDGEPHAEGACAMLGPQGECRIYAHRPYVCRTQGLPLRWLDEAADGQVVELRDICPLNESPEPLEAVPAELCWTLGPAEGRLAELERGRGGGALVRVALRELFRAVA